MKIEKKTYRNGPFKDFIAQGTQVGNVLYMAGQVGISESGIVPADIAEQTAIAYSNMKQVLSQFGADMGNIVDETFFVTDMSELMENVDAVYEERESAYGSMPEVSQTVVQVVALVQPELKIEIKCIAHL
ncbi:MAG: RidA family protein [Halieaceae bacterium]|uniref:RidA family protein n=1 Tax=Haliea alexandrii TaxID=2448162 RepID=UPI000F0BC493|nr:RidA family protein [Haliea alexandrii]MCR9185269.1 RidA family protein [Halieaceae bacterium]